MVTGQKSIMQKSNSIPTFQPSEPSLKDRILENIYLPTNSPPLSTPHRKKREEYWIRLLGTATPFGCNDKIDSIGNLSTPGSNSVNVMRLFQASSRRRHSHGHRRYSLLNLHNLSIDSLVRRIEKPLGVHHIRTKLYSLLLQKLKSFFDESKSILLPDSNSPKTGKI